VLLDERCGVLRWHCMDDDVGPSDCLLQIIKRRWELRPTPTQHCRAFTSKLFVALIPLGSSVSANRFGFL